MTWAPVGLLSSALWFMTWHKECQLGNLLVFSAEFCCSCHGNVRVPAWAPLGLLSSALLFVTWQREGVSLETCWSSQQCSAVHEMATWGCQLKDMLVFSAIPARLHIKLFGRIGMLVLRAAKRESGLCQRPLSSLSVTLHHCVH